MCNITFQQPILCVLLDIRILYNMTPTEIYLIKDYAFNYNKLERDSRYICRTTQITLVGHFGKRINICYAFAVFSNQPFHRDDTANI